LPTFFPRSGSLREEHGCPDRSDFSICSQVPSAFCPGVTGLHLLSCEVSGRQCCAVLVPQRAPSIPVPASKHDLRPSHDRWHPGVRQAPRCPGREETTALCLEDRRRAYTNARVVLPAAFSRLPSRCDPCSFRPPLLHCCCADGLASHAWSCRETVCEEEAREGAPVASLERRDVTEARARLSERYD
jgi:hypothetical protein